VKEWLGVTVFIVGCVIEVTAELQLAVFKHRYPSPSTYLFTLYPSPSTYLSLLSILHLVPTSLYLLQVIHCNNNADYRGDSKDRSVATFATSCSFWRYLVDCVHELLTRESIYIEAVVWWGVFLLCVRRVSPPLQPFTLSSPVIVTLWLINQVLNASHQSVT
jgi:steroid 5-alpha reductase family enzyme